MGTGYDGGNIQEKRYLDRKCQRCGRKTMRTDGEVLGELITLVKEMEGYAFNLYLGEWCSEKCFLEDMKKYE
jgi:hypothetical protein